MAAQQTWNEALGGNRGARLSVSAGQQARNKEKDIRYHKQWRVIAANR